MPDAPVSRRSFLDTLLFTSLAAAGVTALSPIPFFLKPPPAARPRRVRAGDIAQIFQIAPFVTIEYGGRHATAFFNGGEIQVIDHRCTHQGCEVKLNSKSLSFECPCHGAIFAGDGTPIKGPHNGPLARIPWRLVDHELEVGE